MKILYIITKSNWGGAQKYVFDLATHATKDLEVVVAFGGTGTRNAPPGILAEKLQKAGVRTILIPSLERNISWFTEFRTLVDLIHLFEQERPDIVHLNSSKVGGIGALAARLTYVPHIIFTLHGSPFTEDRPWYQKISIAGATWLTILLSHSTITITKKEFEVLSQWPRISHKLKLIHNGIDTSLRLLPNTTIRDAFPADAIIVGTIGELHPNKAQWLLIEAVRTISDKRICVAIVGEGEERTRLEKEIATRKLEDRVKLFGFMKTEEALPNFDIFALPSQKEGLPYVLLEAGLAKLPVVARAIGGIPEIIENEKTGILFSDKNNGLSEAIEKLALDPTLRNQLGLSLNTKVLKDFSCDRMITQTQTLY